MSRKDEPKKKTPEEISLLQAEGKKITERRRVLREKTEPTDMIARNSQLKADRTLREAKQKAEMAEREEEYAEHAEKIAIFKAEGKKLSAERRALREIKNAPKKKIPTTVFVLWAICAVFIVVFWPAAIALAIFILLFQNRLS